MTKSELQSVKNHFKKSDPIIHAAMEKLDFDEWIKPHNNHTGLYYFQRLCREIIGQQLSGKAASTINSRFEALFNGKEITPDNLLRFPDQTLRDAGMSWAKVSYVKNIATAYSLNSVAFDKFNMLTDEEIIKELTSIKGVGPWTAEMFLMFTLGREDVFSHGDLGLRKGFSKVYGIEKPTKIQIEEVVTKWSPYKSYGSFTLWHTLDNAVDNQELRKD